MKKKIFRNMCFLVIFAIGWTSVTLSIFFSGEAYESMKKELQSEAFYIAEALDKGGITYLQKVSIANTETRITWIAEDGTVLFDSEAVAANTKITENHNDRQEVIDARKNGKGEVIRSSNTFGEKTFYYAILRQNGQIVRVSHTIDSVWQNILHTIPYVLCFAMITMGVALLLAHYQVRRIVIPINTLNLEHPEENNIYDELSPLMQRLSKQNRLIQKQMDELKERQQEFSTLTENMKEGLVIINTKGYILSINKRAIQIFGLQAGDYRQKHMLVVNRNLDLQKVIEEGMHGQEQEVQLKFDGRDYQIMSNPISVSKNVYGLVLLLLDITEKKQQERLRQEFTANVSHELRTPLTAISGFAEIMMQGLVKTEDIKPFAEKIYKEANRLIALIADIIQLSQLDEKHALLKKEQVALQKIAQDVIQRLEVIAKEKMVTIISTIEPITLDGNSQVLQEILYNLCENAIKYNKTNGIVELSIKQENQKAIIIIKDTGIGIPVEEQSRVFERFYRVDKSHSRIIGGTGLGLSIVKHGVQLHGGEIYIESQVQKGTTIIVQIPVRQVRK